MHLLISHETVYHYDLPLTRSTQYLRLTPRPSRGLRVLSWDLQLPGPASRCLDAYGNVMHVLTLDGPRQEIHLFARGEVDTDDGPPQPDAELDLAGALPVELFLRDSALTRADPALRDFAQQFAAACRSDAREGLLAMMTQLEQQMRYMPGVTDAATPAAESFANGQGVCQDHAHVFATCARLLGLPARYISGYLAADAEHVASHAWCEVWLPAPSGRSGWLGYDVSNQCLADGRYVRLALGADYLDACPVRGVRLGGGTEGMRARVEVRPGPGVDPAVLQQ
ncbi:transglutaminase family protein [Paucibacter sp. APW11]|uniref:Transglutaminase family protein n=1 Tax=Roseateles aquae TaxID=3077235 RepID=A0ABU3PH79_9BURK|nr:transglutaminase family protein [Paucibacter sp. APW11]MDT9001913.1 transglutaminase family protein [Paucibacter sp. APW11]